jgi:hypothetical protein
MRVPNWSPHDLRHRRISLLHHDGMSWAEIGAKVGQRNLSVTADRYTHVMLEYGEIDRAKLLGRVRTKHTPMHTSGTENSLFGVLGQYRPWLRQATLTAQDAPSGAPVCVWVRFGSDLDASCATGFDFTLPVLESVQHAVHESLDSSQGASRKRERIARVVLELVQHVHVRVCLRGEARAASLHESLSEETTHLDWAHGT